MVLRSSHAEVIKTLERTNSFENVTTATHLHFTLADILRYYIPHDCSIGFPVIVSQDGKDESVANVIASFQEQPPSTVPLLRAINIHPKSGSRIRPRFSLAQHFGWAFATCLHY